MNIFAERLKELRKDKKMTLIVLMQATGIDKTSLSRCERGERLPNLDEIVILAKFFKVSADYLCGLED